MNKYHSPKGVNWILGMLTILLKISLLAPKLNHPVLSILMIDERDLSLLTAKYYFWTWLTENNTFDQAIPSFSASFLLFCNKESIKKTVTTYLPPLDSKVTEFKKTVTYMKYLQNLANDVNIPYVNITLDCGAAVNAFEMKWSQQETFQNIVIHLGDFHFMKGNFQVS